jgi:hypothetical protein
MWCILVVLAVSGEEGDRDIVVLEDMDGCRSVAPRSQRIDYCNGVVALELLETGSTDHSNVYGP